MVVVGVLADQVDPPGGAKDEDLTWPMSGNESLDRFRVAVCLGNGFVTVDGL